mgnify:CR=1 FL=1
MVVSDAKGKTDITIDISGYELDPEKLYRFEFTLTPSGDSEKHYTAYIDLKICMVYPFSDNELVLDRLIYDDGRFSSILLPTRDGERIRFLVSGGMLYTAEIGDGAYTCAGELTQVSLSEYDPTDMLFDLVWADGNTPVRLKKSTVRAFRCINEANDRTYFLLEQENGDVFVNSRKGGSPYVTSIAVNGLKSEVLLHYLEKREIYVSSGSACSKGKKSSVLKEFRYPEQSLDSTIRISFSIDTTKADIDALMEGIKSAQNDLCKVR